MQSPDPGISVAMLSETIVMTVGRSVAFDASCVLNDEEACLLLQ